MVRPSDRCFPLHWRGVRGVVEMWWALFSKEEEEHFALVHSDLVEMEELSSGEEVGLREASLGLPSCLHLAAVNLWVKVTCSTLDCASRDSDSA